MPEIEKLVYFDECIPASMESPAAETDKLSSLAVHNDSYFPGLEEPSSSNGMSIVKIIFFFFCHNRTLNLATKRFIPTSSQVSATFKLPTDSMALTSAGRLFEASDDDSLSTVSIVSKLDTIPISSQISSTFKLV